MKIQNVAVNAVVWVQGYQFIIERFWLIDIPKVGQVVRFIGRCTDHENNDSIRNTSYNGGTYGGKVGTCYSV